MYLCSNSPTTTTTTTTGIVYIGNAVEEVEGGAAGAGMNMTNTNNVITDVSVDEMYPSAPVVNVNYEIE